MCIAAIIHKPISQKYLDEMERDNPHGAGVAWVRHGKLEFRRGLTAERIGWMQTWRQFTYPYLLHFRWATHGKKVASLTHPFPVGRRALMGELEGRASKVLIHNGVWTDYDDAEPLLHEEPKYHELVKADKLSDTQVAAYIIGRWPEWQDDILAKIPWACAVASVNKGRIDIKKYGSSWTTHAGNEYSNLQWLPADEWWEHNGDKHKSRYYSSPYSSRAWGGQYSYPSDTHHEPFTTQNGDRWVYDPSKKTYVIEKPVSATSQSLLEKTAETVVEAAVSESESDANVRALTHFDGWEDYVRARYGDEVAAEIEKDACRIRACDEEDGFDATDPAEDIDNVSEDPSEVNAYLAREYLRKAG